MRRWRIVELDRRVRVAEEEAARVIARAEAIDLAVDEVEEKLALIYEEMRDARRP